MVFLKSVYTLYTHTKVTASSFKVKLLNYRRVEKHSKRNKGIKKHKSFRDDYSEKINQINLKTKISSSRNCFQMRSINLI